MTIDDLLKSIGLKIDIHNLDAPLQQIGDGVDAQSLRSFCSQNADKGEILTSRDWIFIKEVIQGGPLEKLKHLSPSFIGRPGRNKEFLHDIVNNRHSGLDTDKMDYIARDERRTDKGDVEVDHRLIEEAVVAWGKCPQPHTCFNVQAKLKNNI
jgi:hypothetical protein